MTIEQRMTRNPVTIGPDANISEARDLMKKNKVHRLPVLDKDKNLIGIISEKDILYASPSPASSLSIHEMAYLLSKLTVRKIMSKNVTTVNRNIPVEEAARMMADEDLSSLPVVDENGSLVGIVSKSDLFKILIDLFGARSIGVRVSFVVDEQAGKVASISKVISEAGLDIIAFGPFSGTDLSNRTLTIKIGTKDIDKVTKLLSPFAKEIVDIRIA